MSQFFNSQPWTKVQKKSRFANAKAIPVTKIASASFFASASQLKHYRHVRFLTAARLARTKTQHLLDLMYSNNKKLVRLVVSELASSRGYCYLRLVPKVQAKWLLANVGAANAKVEHIRDAFNMSRFNFTITDGPLKFTEVKPGLFHFDYKVGVPVNFLAFLSSDRTGFRIGASQGEITNATVTPAFADWTDEMFLKHLVAQNETLEMFAGMSLTNPHTLKKSVNFWAGQERRFALMNIVDTWKSSLLKKVALNELIDGHGFCYLRLVVEKDQERLYHRSLGPYPRVRDLEFLLEGGQFTLSSNVYIRRDGKILHLAPFLDTQVVSISPWHFLRDPSWHACYVGGEQFDWSKTNEFAKRVNMNEHDAIAKQELFNMFMGQRHEIVHKFIMDNIGRSRNVALLYMAEYGGYCYLHLLPEDQWWKAYAAKSKPRMKLKHIRKMIKDYKLTPLETPVNFKVYANGNVHLSGYDLPEKILPQNLFTHFFGGTIIGSIPPPNPIKMSNFGNRDHNSSTGYRDELTSSTTRNNIVNRVERTRVDVRYIEQKLDYLIPVINGISANPGGGSGQTGPAPINPGVGPENAQDLGNGNFPENLEGQIMRILLNLRNICQVTGVAFQASTRPQRQIFAVPANGGTDFSVSIQNNNIYNVVQPVTVNSRALVNSSSVVVAQVANVVASICHAYYTSPTLPGEIVGGSATTPAVSNATTERTLRNLLALMTTMGTPHVQASINKTDIQHILEDTEKQREQNAPVAESVVVRDAFSIEDILARPLLLSRTLWSTQTQGELLASHHFPQAWSAMGDDSRHLNLMLSAFAFFKGDIVFKIEVNSTDMYGGILSMYFDYFGRSDSFTPVTTGTIISNHDPVYLDLSQGDTISLIVPFAAVSQYISRQHAPFATQHVGTINVHAFSNLFRPEGMADVEVRLYAFLRKPQVEMITHHDFRAFARPQASIVKTITSFAHSFLPNMPEVYPLALEEGYKVEREETCRVEKVADVFGLVRTFQWQTTATHNQVMASVPIHPMVNLRLPGPPARCLPTRLGHIGRHFAYWNGTLIFRVQVAASRSHAGKLLIVLEGGPSYSDNNTGAIQSNTYTLLDIKQEHEVELAVPYIAATPWKPTYLANPFGDISTCCTGRLRFYSGDGIKTGLLGNSNITVNIFMKPGSDFQYFVPRNGLQGTGTIGRTIVQASMMTALSIQLRKHNEDFNDIYKVLRRYTTIGRMIEMRNASNTTIPPITIGPHNRGAGSLIVIPVMPFPPGTLENSSISSLVAGFAFWRGSISYKFKLNRATTTLGSFEVFHRPTMGIPPEMGDRFYVSFGYDQNAELSNSGSFDGSQTFHGEIDREWEITVPYYSMYDHLHIPLTTWNTTDVSRKYPLLSTHNGCVVIRPSSRMVDYSLTVSMSCGDDFTLLTPTAFPPINIREGTGFGDNVQIQAQSGVLDDTNESDFTNLEADAQGIFTAFKQAQDAISNVSGVSSVVSRDVGDSAKNFLTGILEDAILGALKRSGLAAIDWFKDMLSNINWKYVASMAIGAAVIWAHRYTLGNMVCQIVLTTLKAFLPNKLVDKIPEMVSMCDESRIRVQNGSDMNFKTFIQLCCGVVAILLSVDLTKNFKAFVKNIGDLGRSMSGVKAGVEAIRTFSEFLGEKVAPMLESDDSLALRGLVGDTVSVLEEVHTLNLEEMKVSCMTENSIKERVLYIDGRLKDLAQAAILQGAPASVSAPIRVAQTKMEKLRTEVMHYKGEDGYRIDPFHVSVFGPPGTGKSAMLGQVNSDFIHYFDWPTTNALYTRATDNVYWDGYMGQTTVLFDDLGQMANAQPPSDLSELIPLKSNAPWQVHMASIAEKGTFFTSKLILSTTNFKMYHDCNFIKEKAALHRRRNVLLEIRRKTDEFGNPILIDIEEPGDMTNSQFRILNSLSGDPETDFMTYEEIMGLVLLRAKKYYEGQEALVARNKGLPRPSSIVQSLILDRQTRDEIPGVVMPDGDFKILDAEAQAQYDGVSEQGKRLLRNFWISNFWRAVKRRDFGALASSFSFLQKSRIADAVSQGTHAGLSAMERVVYSICARSQRLSAACYAGYSIAKEGIIRVGNYMRDLFHRFAPEKKTLFSLAIVATGALAVSVGVAKLWSSFMSSTGSVDMSVFEGPKDTEVNTSLKVRFESGIDDQKTRRGTVRRVVLQSADASSLMAADVPNEFHDFTVEQLLEQMKKDTVPKGQLLEINSPTAAYRMEESAKAQASSDPEMQTFLRGRLVDNMGFILHVKTSTRMRCLALCDQYIVVPRHFFTLAQEQWENGDIMKFVLRGKVYEISFYDKHLLLHPNRDQAIYMVSSRVTGAQSIISRIATRQIHEAYKTCDGTLACISRHRDDGTMFVTQHHLPSVNRMLQEKGEWVSIHEKAGSTYKLCGYNYFADTIDGDCGAVLLTHNPRCSAKILGLHVAGHSVSHRAYAELLVREEIETMIEELKTRVKAISRGTVLDTFDIMKDKGIVVQGQLPVSFQDLSENVDVVGVLPSSLIKFTPSKTQIRQSELQEVWPTPPETEPAVLTRKDVRNTSGKDPLVVQVSGYGLESKPFRLDHLDIIKGHMVTKYRKHSGMINKRVLSLDEAINGIPGVDYADALNMHSAEGSFWNLSRPMWAHNKSWMFENTAPEGAPVHYKIAHRPLLEKIVHRIQQARQGKRVLSIGCETLKDERRPLKKTRGAEGDEDFVPSTRSFTILPVDYNIVVRQYFWDFAAMVMKNRPVLECQVGIDPCSIEWTTLMMRLMAKSSKGFAADYKNYDRQTPAEFMDACCDIINEWYNDGPVNAQIRKVLMGEAYDHYSILRSGIVHIDKGLPSGFPLTVIVNSMNNDIYRYMSWLHLAPPALKPLDRCDEHTDAIFYGDDNVHSIDQVAAPFFNMKTMGEFLEEHNVMLTDEHKNHWSTAEALVDIETVSFLKRLFKRHLNGNFYLAPLEKRSIEERLLWVTDSKFESHDELLAENLKTSMRDAFHWGPGYFLELQDKCEEALEKIGKKHLMPNVSYGSEEYAWICTMKGMDRVDSDPLLKNVFGPF